MARRIKRDDLGYFTHSVPETEKIAGRAALCDSCGRSEFCDLNGLRNSGAKRDHYAVIDVLACDIFVPRVKFNNPAIPAGKFNTMRLGDKSAVYEEGQYIQIINADDQHIIYAMVTEVWVGNKDAVLKSHGHWNHTVKELELKRSEKTERMQKRLPRNYHTRLWERTEYLSAIYLKPIVGRPPVEEYTR